MHSVEAARPRVWLAADVPREVADEFAARAQQLHRSSRAQLRVLVEEFLNEQELESPAAGVYAGRAG